MADMKTFKTLATKLSPNVALLVEGAHGIGKSQGAYQAAQELGLPVKELRLALMDTGDFIGLPDLVTRPFDDAAKERAYHMDLIESLRNVESKAAADAVVMSINTKHGRRTETRFAPPSWLVDCSRAPHVLFLDEMNRALPEVLQASFQLILDRNLNGVPLHPQTRIVAAVNTGSQYRVEATDPALRDRFAIIELRPTFDDWVDWAREKVTETGKQNVHPLIVDFVVKNPAHLEHTNGDQDLKKVYPSRRSWARLSSELDNSGCLQGAPDSTQQSLIHAMSMAMVGIEAATGLVPHIIDSTRQLSADDILDRFELDSELAKLSKGKKKGSLVRERVQWDTADALHGLNDRLLTSYADPGKAWTDKQNERFSAYFQLLPGEICTALWCKIMGASKGMHDRLIPLTKTCTKFVLAAVQESGLIQKATTAATKK